MGIQRLPELEARKAADLELGPPSGLIPTAHLHIISFPFSLELEGLCLLWAHWTEFAHAAVPTPELK